MGQSAACTYWNGAEGSDASYPEVRQDIQAGVEIPEPGSLADTGTASIVRKLDGNRTVFRPPSETLKAIKAQDAKKQRNSAEKLAAQERWAKTKAEWEANVVAEMDAMEAKKQQPEGAAPVPTIMGAVPAPGTEADRYAPDERKLALQAIKEEMEEERKAAEAELQPAGEKECKAAEAELQPVDEKDQTSIEAQDAAETESAKVFKEPVLVPETEAVEQENTTSQPLEEVVEIVQDQQAVQESERPPLAEVKVDQPSAQLAQSSAILDAFLAKNGFDGVNAKRRRTLQPSIYPVHLAAEQGDAQLIGLLLEAGADRLAKDSRNRTPEMVAKKKNSKGSHDEALAALA